LGTTIERMLSTALLWHWQLPRELPAVRRFVAALSSLPAKCAGCNAGVGPLAGASCRMRSSNALWRTRLA